MTDNNAGLSTTSPSLFKNSDTAQICIKNVSRWHTAKDGRRDYALQDVSLFCQQGEFLALLGPSGCGKTTLLNIIAGLDRPNAGEVVFDGEPVRGPSATRGVIFQHYSLFPWLTVRQNIDFGLRYRSLSRQERRARVEQYLDLVHLTNAADRLPKELSGGMKQRCALARALVVQPQTLLMDEPFGALDALTRRQLQTDLLDIYEREQKTIVFVTHDVDEAVYLSRRIAIMSASPGRITHIVNVPLPTERDPSLITSDEFISCRRKVWELIPKVDLDEKSTAGR